MKKSIPAKLFFLLIHSLMISSKCHWFGLQRWFTPPPVVAMVSQLFASTVPRLAPNVLAVKVVEHVDEGVVLLAALHKLVLGHHAVLPQSAGINERDSISVFKKLNPLNGKTRALFTWLTSSASNNSIALERNVI